MHTGRLEGGQFVCTQTSRNNTKHVPTAAHADAHSFIYSALSM